MGRVIKQVCFFLGISAVLYVAIMAFMSHVRVLGRPLVFRTGDYYNWPGGDSWARYRTFDPSVRYDAVIIGSSHAYRGYDPYVFRDRGYTVFNLGSSSQTPLNTYQLIKYYLDSTNCPVLIFDVFERVFRDTGLESTSDLTQNQPSDAAALGMAWELRDLRGLNMMALRMLTDLDKPYYTEKDYVGLGFSVLTDSMKYDAPAPPSSVPPLLDRQKHFFEACVRLCNERGIRVVVSSHYERRDWKGTAHADFATYINSVLSGTGIPYLDYTDTKGVDERNWFGDKAHLNVTGARIFTGHLVDSLESLGILRHERIDQPAGDKGGDN